MKSRGFILVCLLLLGIFLAGCLSGSDPISPMTYKQESIKVQESGTSNRVLWGYWNVEIDPDRLSPDVKPIRSSQFNANVLMFMQPPVSPTHMLSIAVDGGASDPPNNLLVFDVTLRHPFPELPIFRGFDVRGIFMSSGANTTEFDPSATYAQWYKSNPNDAALKNADGYTRWWNPAEFTSYDKIFGYIHGAFVPGDYMASATINPYKYFADELDAQSDFVLDPTNRGTFSSAGVNSRRYIVKFDGAPFKFNYAVDASWSKPDADFAPDYPVEAFDLNANCQEAYQVSVSDAGSDAWYQTSSLFGGKFRFDIEIFDWQGSGTSAVQDEIGAIWVESTAFFNYDNGKNYLDLLQGEYEVYPGSNEHSVVYHVVINPDFLFSIGSPGNYPYVIAVESSDPASYEPQIEGGGGAFDFPLAPLAAWNVGFANIKTEPPSEPVGTLYLGDEIHITTENPYYHATYPSIDIEKDEDVVIACVEWWHNPVDPFNYRSYAQGYRSQDGGSTWPDKTNGMNTGYIDPPWIFGASTKIWPSINTNTSWRTMNHMNLDSEYPYEWWIGYAETVFNGPYNHETANYAHDIDYANEIVQDSEGYIYLFGDRDDAITFKRSELPDRLEGGPTTNMWENHPSYALATPGRLSRVRASVLYNSVSYFAYYEPGNNVIRLAKMSLPDWESWDTSTIIYDGTDSGTHSPEDPGLWIDNTGFQVVFKRVDFITGFNELCYTGSDDGIIWSDPVVIRSNVFELLEAPVCGYHLNSTYVLATTWWENDKVWSSWSIDSGVTWSEPMMVSEAFNENGYPDLVISEAGDWHFVFSSFNPDNGLWEIHYRKGYMVID